jgi:hypothetical protein
VHYVTDGAKCWADQASIFPTFVLGEAIDQITSRGEKLWWNEREGHPPPIGKRATLNVQPHLRLLIP